MDYQLIRSKRKTIALYVRDGAVELRAPLNAPKAEIDTFIASKEKWIIGRLTQSRERIERREAFRLSYGGTVTYRAKEHLIAAKDGDRLGFDYERFYMPPNLTPAQIKNACIQIYKMLAKRDLTETTFAFAKRMGVMPAAVKITGAAARWGSCSGKGSINFSWRLIMADDDVIDYVVVHELAHITEMNHSAAFWRIVDDILPDRKQRQARLNELQKRLGGEDWT
ncbi:MAG: M48 family metallopeptidase [Oscillospiraceae bacterium]|jgi:predicted metal-dependent hydrolase|nr:M48 family metallopeptidase [Oscillospiraceae bacterium]